MSSRPRRTGLAIGLLTAGLLLGSLFGGVAVASHQFSDVPDSNQFHDDIQWLVDQDIATGFQSDGTFRPTQPVTRQAMAAFMHRFAAATYVRSTNTDPAASTQWILPVACDDGDRAIAGGGRINFADIFLTESHPSPDGSSWVVVFESDDTVTMDPTDIRAWVTCAPQTINPGG
jgi:hypothetical protein